MWFGVVLCDAMRGRWSGSRVHTRRSAATRAPLTRWRRVVRTSRVGRPLEMRIHGGMSPCAGFAFDALVEELVLGGVFVRVYIEDAGCVLDNSFKFADEVLLYIASGGCARANGLPFGTFGCPNGRGRRYGVDSDADGVTVATAAALAFNGRPVPVAARPRASDNLARLHLQARA